MKVGYMTNAWGSIVGHPAGVTSVKDLYYLSTGGTEEAMEAISSAGFEYIEIFDGNLAAYSDNKSNFSKLMSRNGLELLAVYTGANFIFKGIINEEFEKIKIAASLAKEFGARHLVVGGGAIRHNGIREDDYNELAKDLNKTIGIALDNDLIASYHPHLGTIVQAPDQLDKLMEKTEINLCPDCGHIAAGGGNPVEVVNKYSNRIEYIHLKDFKEGMFYPPGMGSIDLIKIIDTIKGKAEFTIETDGYDGKPSTAVETSFKYLENIFKD